MRKSLFMSMCVAGQLLLGGSLALAESTTGTASTTKRSDVAADKKASGAKRGDKQASESDSNSAPAADNTGVNKRDRDDSVPTADQQKNDKTDVELAAEIRRAIVKDDTLSVNAHNVKVIVQNGQVTLRGPVASKAEKATIEKKVNAIVGKEKARRTVVNEIEVAP